MPRHYTGNRLRRADSAALGVPERPCEGRGGAAHGMVGAGRPAGSRGARRAALRGDGGEGEVRAASPPGMIGHARSNM